MIAKHALSDHKCWEGAWDRERIILPVSPMIFTLFVLVLCDVVNWFAWFAIPSNPCLWCCRFSFLVRYGDA